MERFLPIIRYLDHFALVFFISTDAISFHSSIQIYLLISTLIWIVHSLLKFFLNYTECVIENETSNSKANENELRKLQEEKEEESKDEDEDSAQVDEEAEELQHQQLDATLAGENEADLSECLIAKALSAVEKEQHHHNKKTFPKQ